MPDTLGAGLSVSAIVLFGLFIRTAVNTLRYAAAAARREPGAVSSLVTQFTAYGAGLLATFLFAASQLGDSIDIAGATLGSADTPTKVILGLMVASLGGTVSDVIRGIDQSQSAKVPSLIPTDTGGGSKV